MVSSNKKWQISFFSGILFIITIHPLTFTITNNLFSNIFGSLYFNNKITNIGLIIHTILFILLVRYSMNL